VWISTLDTNIITLYDTAVIDIENLNFMEKDDKWLTVPQYAKLIGKSRQQVYMDIRLGKIKKYRKIKKVVERIQISVDNQLAT